LQYQYFNNNSNVIYNLLHSPKQQIWYMLLCYTAVARTSSYSYHTN